ncbi:MAG: hypothetical protein LBT67_01325 [Holosporaceae bacterium]|jgi:hypothetical protein|nr:hypothetical protein [Holosporaceae bacterium]
MSVSKKFLLICSVASVLLRDDACALEKRIAGGPQVEVNVEAKIEAVFDVTINSENKKVELLDETVNVSPVKNREISVRYNNTMKGKAIVDCTFEARGSAANDDVITYWVNFFPDIYDSSEFITFNTKNSESPEYNFISGKEGVFIFKLEDGYNERDLNVDTYTGSIRISFVPTE